MTRLSDVAFNIAGAAFLVFVAIYYAFVFCLVFAFDCSSFSSLFILITWADEHFARFANWLGSWVTFCFQCWVERYG